MRCLVTGAAGFIGSSLSELLLGGGHDVLGVDCFTDYYPRSIKLSNVERSLSSERFKLVEGDLLELDLDAILAGVDWVFHQAAQPGVRMSWGSYFDVYVRNNILATHRLLEAARGSHISRFVFASSSSVYGDSPDLPLRESAKPQPISPYGVTKLAAENLCYLYFVNYGVPTVSLRYFTVYGPRQRPDMAAHKFIRSALGGAEIIVHGDGEQTRDFTYISDVCAANTLAAEAKSAVGRVFNIGGGSRLSLAALLDLVRELTGRELNIRRVRDQKGDVRHTLSDTSAAREALGYMPRMSIREGLARQVEWMRGLPGDWG